MGRKVSTSALFVGAGFHTRNGPAQSSWVWRCIQSLLKKHTPDQCLLPGVSISESHRGCVGDGDKGRKPHRYPLFGGCAFDWQQRGKGPGKEIAKSLGDQRGSRDPAPTRAQPLILLPSPPPTLIKARGRDRELGGWVSEELRLEPRACSLLRALSGTLNIHTHFRAHTHAQTQTLTNTHTLTCTDLALPRGRAAPAVSLLQARGKWTGSNMNEIRPERLHFSSNHATSGQTAEYVPKFYFAFRVSSYASTISCGKLKL